MRKLLNNCLLRPNLKEQQQCCLYDPNFCLTSAFFELYTVRNAYYKYDDCGKI